MSVDAPNASEPAPAASTTDEDILRLRSRLEREFAQVGQKLADAEETLVDIEVTLRTYETGTRTRLPAVTGTAGEKITSRLKAVSDGLGKIRDWVSKPKKEEEGVDGAAPSSPRGPRDMADRLEEALQGISAEIRDREREASELDRKLHEAQKELIRARAQEQHARETQIKIGQTKQLSEDLERRMAMLDEMVRSFEAPAKPDTGIRPKPKDGASAIPKIDDRLQGAIDEALKTVAAQEKKVTDLEKQVQQANAGLVDERTRQQRIRAMQLRLRQARHFSQDLQRSLAGLGSSLEDLSRRAAGLLRPETPPAREGTRILTKPPPSAQAPASKPSGS
jgi:predicted RNase H-like nuclease (RuvC/YqgF family)